MSNFRCCLIVCVSIVGSALFAQDKSAPAPLTLDQLKADGAQRSRYRKQQTQPVNTQTPKANLAAFRKDIEPVLKKNCVRCHGAKTTEGNIRIDTLDPDLLHGEDVNWWIEIMAVISNGEMPPADAEELADKDRQRLVEWLSSEIQLASIVRRVEQGHSSFRRMTRYEYNYALQDLLGLPYNFAKDLPPEAPSEDGFQNSSEMLHMSAIQFATYRELGRNALKRATVEGSQPKPIFWGVTMKEAAARDFTKQDQELEKLKEQHKDDPAKLKQEIERRQAAWKKRIGNAHYKNLKTGRTVRASWGYPGARYAWKPLEKFRHVPADFDHVAVIPPRQRLIVELGDTIPEEGTLRVRIRASRTSVANNVIPSLQLEFGWQASNDSHASVRISKQDRPIGAGPDNPQFYQWDLPLSEIYPRNGVRNISKMGDLPSPSEYIKFVNSSVSEGDIQIDYVEVAAPMYRDWPTASHKRIFFDSDHRPNETNYARDVLSKFMQRAWRRQVSKPEIDQKLALFAKVRPACQSFEEAMIEVLATVISSPKFLYLSSTAASDDSAKHSKLNDEELASRLAMFLWCSIPDDELLQLAAKQQLHNSDVLKAQINRMIADARSERFSRHFVRQWLDMQLLDFLNIDRKTYPGFDPSLKEAMQEEPIAVFHEMLGKNHSVIDFLHADYTMANERLARHYGIKDVLGNHFRRVKIPKDYARGGLLTQAGLLAMNSDGKDSHPLKRGIWMLESLLNDPPPPPPPAVPEIDVADPEIAKLTLKQRIEKHRSQAACISCHAKIDPWGIAFENFDAVGSWRTQVNGQPVDASSQLFNKQKLNGIYGLKRFLLANRQDQFARSMVHKMSTFALGRPLTFGDRSSVDQMTADLRKQGDGLATMISVIASSDLFQSK